MVLVVIWIPKIVLLAAWTSSVPPPIGLPQEKPSEFVAQFKFTVLLLPGGTKKVTGALSPSSVGLDFQKDKFNTTCEIKDDGLKQLLATSANPKKNKKKKGKEDEKKEDA